MNKISDEFYSSASLPLALLVACALSVVSLLYIPLPILPSLTQTYRLSPSTSAYALQAFSLAYALGFLVFGPLSDRVGRRPVLVVGLVVLALVSLGLMLVSSPGLFLLGRGLQGFAAASFPPVALAYITECGTARQRIWGVAWMSTAFLSAGLLGQIYGVMVAGRWGFAWALLPLMVIYLATALRIALLKQTRVSRGSAGTSWWAAYEGTGRVLKDPKLRRVYVCALLLLMVFVAFYISLDVRLGAELEQQGVSLLAARAIALPAFLLPLLVALLTPRWGALRLATAGLLVTAVGLALCAVLVNRSAYSLLAASVLFVAGVCISVPSLISRVASVAEPSVRGLAVSLYTFVLFIGASLGPLLASRSATWSDSVFFLVLAAGIGLAALYSAWPVSSARCSTVLGAR
ncbi:MFS transporter [Pseudomonas idahonensis]|uniref:MFS transporter n=1 Tax=Pseudomonas idahonensis TaxID=2942628 RepID=UPI0030CA7E55